MTLEFETLILTLFKSYIQKTTFKLQRGPGLHFVCGDNHLDPQLGSNGAGKALADTLLLDTPSGPRKWGALKVGDYVFGLNGLPTKIIGRYPQGKKRLYKVEFDDGTSTLACAEHLWRLEDRKQRKEVTITTQQILDCGVSYNVGTAKPLRWLLPRYKSVSFHNRSELPIDPYVLGMWLGNGGKNSGVITVNAKDQDVVNRLAKINYARPPRVEKQRSDRPNQYSLYKRNGIRLTKNGATAVMVFGLKQRLRKLGLVDLNSHERFIPTIFLYSSIKNRMELLRGLMDSDGYCGKGGGTEFTSTSKQLVDAVIWLVRSLGGKALIRWIGKGHFNNTSYKTAYTARLTFDELIFYAQRKGQRQKTSRQKRYLSRWIKSIKPVGIQSCSCIRVEATDAMFLANDFIPTHNSTLWDALCWCCYGRTGSGLRNPDLRPWSGHGTTSVTLHLKVDGTAHTITRTIAPNNLTLNDKVVSQDTIDRLLLMPFDTFTNTVLLGQARPLFLDLTSRAKMELFSEVLNLQRWEARSKAAADAVESLTGVLQEREQALAQSKGRLTQSQQLLQGLQAKSEEWLAERERRVLVNEQEKESLIARLQTVQKHHDAMNLELDGVLTELRPLQKQLRELNGQHSRTQARTHDLEGAMKKGATCPTCGQVITGAAQRKAHLKQELEGVREEARKQLKVIGLLEQNEKEFIIRSDRAQSELMMTSPELGALKAKVEALQKDSRVQASESNPLAGEINNLKRELARLQREVDDGGHRCQTLNRKIERRRFWIKGFREVELYLVEDVLAELQFTINCMLPQAGLNDWQIKLSIERETGTGKIQRGIDVLIMSPDSANNQRATRWESWSGGEGQRLRVVGSLALSEVLLQRAGVAPSMEILDEPTQHLSLEGVLDLCGYLGDRAMTLKKVIYYTDQQSVQGTQFSSVITVTKSAAGSTV